MRPESPLVRDWSDLAWGVVLLLVAMSCVLDAVQEWQMSRRFRHALTADGIVTYSVEGWKSRDDGEPPETEYRFKTSDGIELDGISHERYVTEGEQIEVEYLPSDPRLNRIKGTNPSSSMIAMDLLIAGCLAYVSAIQFLYAYSDKTARWAATRFAENRVIPEPSDMPFSRFPVIVLSAASAGMLFLGAMDERSHAYYQILRWLICSASVTLAVITYQWGRLWALWLFVPMAILFNPIAPIHLSRDSWAWIDIFAAVVMAVVAFTMKPKQ